MDKEKQAPKLGIFSIAFICTLTISAIVLPIVIVHFNQTFIKQTFENLVNQGSIEQTYNASSFSIFGNAVLTKYNGHNYVGDINAKNGFRFTVNSNGNTTAKLSIKYRSDKRGGILKVNNKAQYIYFPSTNWQWGTKEVVAQLQQGKNVIEFCGSWLTDYAPDIAEIKITPDNNLKQDNIVGTWKGTYTENGTGGKGNLTLTINYDMTGVFETSITNRKSRSQSIKASFTVSITCSNGNYSIRGKEWISTQPSDYSFDDLDGTVNNGVFSGRNFKLEKTTTAPTLSSQQENNTEKENHKMVTNSTVREEPKAKIDYSSEVETALSKAIAAFDDGRYNDAFKCYTEAANYPTNRSTSIKEAAAKKFKEKAERLMANNDGECDEVSTQLLKYTNSLNPSSEIQRLLNKCGSISTNSYKFPQASERILSASDLSTLSKYDLKIMRNEIFARHGYIFTTNDMKNYFQSQSWYTPRYSNVNSMLTSIEKENIALIKKYE